MQNMKEINLRNLGIYAIAPFRNRGDILVGTGKWNRAKEKHFESVKSEVKGRVILIDNKGRLIKKSKEFESMVYSILPIKEGVLVGCRKGELKLLDFNLNIKKDYGIVGEGIYNMINRGRKVFLACRNGNLAVLDVGRDKISYRNLSDARLWSLFFFKNKLLVGDFKGNLFIDNKKKNLLKAAIWNICEFNNKLVIGTADMRLLFLDGNFKIGEELKLNEPVTYLSKIEEGLIIGGYFGGLYSLKKGKIKEIVSRDKIILNNPIWSMNWIKDKLGVAWANGKIMLFDKKELS